MLHVIQVIGFANGDKCPYADQYLMHFDFEADAGRGYGSYTDKKQEAMTFTSQDAALLFWKTPSKTHPTRADGKPNRPFTACTILIDPVLPDDANPSASALHPNQKH